MVWHFPRLSEDISMCLTNFTVSLIPNLSKHLWCSSSKTLVGTICASSLSIFLRLQNHHLSFHELLCKSYRCSELTHICMQLSLWLCSCFRQGHLCCKPVTASRCFATSKYYLLGTKVKMSGPAGTMVDTAAAAKQRIIAASPNVVTAACSAELWSMNM